MESNSKKREGEDLQMKDLVDHQTKRQKSKSCDYANFLIKVLSRLSVEKKLLVKKLGFGSLLKFTCSSNVNEFFVWLMNHFNTNSACVKFSNGFSFFLSPLIVHKVLGIPIGSKKIQLKGNLEISDVTNKEAGIESATVEELCSVSFNDLDEATFCLHFMQLVLAAFIAPNGHGSASSLYYHILENPLEIPKYDWCSFTLNWLIMHIKKFQRGLLQENQSEVGGCKLVLVIPYFEFLITSEFNLGTSLPRLPLWSTHVINSYIALDTLHGSKRNYGRLSRKHISCTPFGENASTSFMEMPTEIYDYINLKLRTTSFSYVTDKDKLESLARKFFHTLVRNSIPTVKSYIDDIVDNISSSYPWYDQREQEPIKNPWSSEKEVEDFIQNLYSSGKLLDGNEDISTSKIFKNLLLDFSNSCMLGDSNVDFDLPINKEFERSLYPQLEDSNVLKQYEQTTDITQYLLKEIKEGRERIDAQQSVQNYKFSLQSMNFYLPGEEEGTLGQQDGFNLNLCFKKEDLHQNKMLMRSHNFNQGSGQYSTPLLMDAGTFQQAGLNYYGEPQHASPPQSVHNQQSRDGSWGFSLNERLLGKRITPIIEEIEPGLSSFDKLTEDLQPNTQDYKTMLYNKLKDIDPLLHNALNQCGADTMDSDNIIMSPHKVTTTFISSSSLHLNRDKQEQVIFSTEFEKDFYSCLINMNQEFCARIFEINNVWVDQRTLALSLSPGGWIHPYVMDCFGILTNTRQNYQIRNGYQNEGDILKHVVIKEVTEILMDPKLNYDHPKYKLLFGLNNVGFRMENARMVYIPCPNDKSWILVVTNLYDKSFDVLNSDYSMGKFSSIVTTVI